MSDISPLFALEAENLLTNGHTEDAIELCKKGLEVYPDYPAAISILAKAYNLLGKKDESDNIILSAKNNSYGKILDKITFENHSEQVPFHEIEISNLPITASNNNENENNLIEDKELKVEDNSELKNKIENPSNFNVNNINNLDLENLTNNIVEENIKNDIEYNDLDISPTLEENINYEINKIGTKIKVDVEKYNLEPQDSVFQLIASRISIPKTIHTSNKSKNVINTEMMATIYAQQGNIEDAILVYNNLINLSPNKKDYFQEKINQLKNNQFK